MLEQRDVIAALQEALGHQFADHEILLDALTHRSFANERPREARTDNDRLEFLGDAVLQWCVSAILWEAFPDATAGEMTRRRADLVCEEGLAEVALDVGLAPSLRLGKGEDRSGGRENPRLLSSAFEACIAAVYMDGGPSAVRDVCEGLFAPRLARMAPGFKDYKTRLQEVLQSQGSGLPQYVVQATTGPDHARIFAVQLMVGIEVLAEGKGRSKLEAEQLAASKALDRLELDPEQ